jgi:hypothetical protein
VIGATVVDGDGNLAAAYGFGEAITTPSAYLVRPDGYVSYRSSALDATRLFAHLTATTIRIEA